MFFLKIFVGFYCLFCPPSASAVRIRTLQSPGPDGESVSDLGNQDRPNSMKLGGDIDLDELLLNPVVFVFVLSSFQFFGGGGGGLFFGGLRVQTNTLMRVNFLVPLQ